jgi:4'-phosphopantetheinyl transferase
MKRPHLRTELHPVLMVVPAGIQNWTGPRRVRALSRLARAAARMSARRAGGVLGRLTKDADGVPLPANGWRWSVAHKPGYVAGVAGPGPLGIDIEPVIPRSRKLFSKIATPEEWRLGHEEEWHLFYRFWTAKEAVLKAVGMGLKGLSCCRVVAIEAPLQMTLEYDGRRWPVEQVYWDGYLAALASEDLRAHWIWPEAVP